MIAIRLLKDGAVVREEVFPGIPVRIGRGAECDFVVFDPSVSKTHAEVGLDEGGQVAVRDLGSRNGLHIGPVRTGAMRITGALRCHVGLVELEIERLSEETTQEIKLRDWQRFEQRRTWVDNLRYLLVGVTGWLAVVVLDPGFWSPWQKNRPGTLLGQGLAALVALPVLGFLLLLVLKVIGRRVRLADTLQAFSALVWLWPLRFLLSYAAYYLLSAPAHARLESLLPVAALVVTVVHAASVRRTGSMVFFRGLWATAVGLLLFGMSWTAGLAARRSGTPATDYHAQVPIAGYAGRAESLANYLDRVGQASQEAARQAEAVRLRQQ